MTLGDAILYLATDDKGLDSGLSSAKSKATSWAGNLGGSVARLMGGAMIGGAAAIAAGVGAIGVGAFNVSQQLDQANRDMAASLGITTEAAQKYNDVIKAVYTNNFGESITEVGAAVAEVAKQFGLAADSADLQPMVEKAFALRDAFGPEIQESLSAVQTLMDNFGLSATEAFDFVAAGYQKGLDRSGDFLDTINEYGTQFGNAGANAGQFFSIMETGLQGGMLGTDKAADAFKEFRLRIQDGSKTTADGLAQLGLDAEKITQGLADGSLTAADAFQMVTDRLRETDDATVRMQAGAALLGTQYEDLGDSAVAGLDMAKTSMDDLAGSADKVNQKYGNLGSLMSGMWRRTTVALSPVSDAMLRIANENAPAIEAAFANIEAALTSFIEKSNFTWEPDFKQVTLGDLFSFIQDGATTSINLGDYIKLEWGEGGLQSFSVGDLFEFDTAGATKTLDIADYVSLVWGGDVFSLHLGDLFAIDSTGAATAINLGDYVSVLWSNEKFSLHLGDLFAIETGADGLINLGDYLSVEWDTSGIQRLQVGDLLDFSFEDFSWPELSQASMDTFTALTGWEWPDTPAEIGDLVEWAFPDLDGATAALLGGLIAWAWPSLGAGTKNAIDRLLTFSWPDLKAPNWLNSLANWSPAMPGWVSSLLNWRPSMPSLPGWLGGGESDSDGKSLPGRSLLGSAAPIVNVYVQNVSSAVDVETLAYTIQKRLAGV